MFDHELRDAAERVLNSCRQRRLKVATAESCTGGLIAATLTAIAGSSDVVDRAFVTYSNEAKRDMIVLSKRPEDLEMTLSGFTDYITPIEHFFVRTHVYVPTVDVAEWKLNIAGEVGTPLTLTMDDLKKCRR